MSTTIDSAAVESALKIIKETAVAAESKEKADKPETLVHRHSKRFNVKQADFLKFMKANGITADTVSRISDLQRSWNTGCAQFALEELKTAAPEALKDKDFVAAGGMKMLQVGVKTTVKDGASLVAVKAFSENPIPNSESGEVSQKFGQTVIRHKISIAKAVDAEQVEACATAIEALVRGKF